MCRREGMSRHLPLLHRAGKSSGRSSSSTGKSAIIEGEGWQGERSSLVVALSPHTSVDPRGAHPTALSILGGSREVSVHQMPCHFPSLPIHRLAPVGHAERSALMKRFSYGERDYGFGQAILTLRTTIGLTQAGLADLLGVSRRAVGAVAGMMGLSPSGTCTVASMCARCDATGPTSGSISQG